jgi:uncharacterized protein with HEPN domain
MVDHIDYVSAKLQGRSFAEFCDDRDLRYAVERALEIVSEASRRVPRSLQNDRPEIPWRQVADFGNVLRHTYFDIESETVWAIATKQLAPPKEALIAIRERLAS